jgi:hypothetical protein
VNAAKYISAITLVAIAEDETAQDVNQAAVVARCKQDLSNLPLAQAASTRVTSEFRRQVHLAAQLKKQKV